MDNIEVEDLLDLGLQGPDLELISIDQTVLLVEQGLESCNVRILASQGNNIGSEHSDFFSQGLDVGLQSQNEGLFLLECELEGFVVGLPLAYESTSGLELNLQVHHLGKISLADRVFLSENCTERGDDGLQLKDGFILCSPFFVEKSNLVLVPGDVALSQPELDHELIVSLTKGVDGRLELQ